jgi:hypothetical protein
MNSNLNEDQWKDIADTLRELNIDFDRRVETLFPRRPKIFPAPPTRPSPGSGVCMTMNAEHAPCSPSDE